MKKTILLVAIIGLLSMASYAQDGQRPNRQEMEQRRNAMYDSLSLTKDQRDKMITLDDESRTQMRAIRSDESLTEDQQREKMMQIRKDQKAKRDAILTPEQAKKYDEMMQQMRRNGPPQRQ